MLSKLLTSAQVAEVLGVTQQTVVDYTNSGRLQGSKIGKQFRYSEEDVDTFVKNLRHNKGR